MKLLRETIDILSGEQPSLTDALVKTKVILHQLGRKDLAEWVNLELTGYRKEVEVPTYRIVKGTVHGNITNGYYTHNNRQLPTLHLDQKWRKRFEAIEIRDAISGVEALAKKDEGTLTVPIAPEFYSLFQKGFTEGYQVERAWSDIGMGVIGQVSTEVRSRLLDFLLELSERVEDDMTEDQLRQVGRAPETGSMFNHAVLGDNVTIIVGNQNSQTVSNQITRGDFDALAALLQKNMVAAPDIDALRTAIETDKGATELVEKKFGPEVRDWMTRMYGKAIDTSWGIEVAIAANLMTDALKAYYGWLVP